VFTVWMGLFAIQTWLVMSKQVAVHRRLGVVGGVFAVALVVLGYVIAVLGAQTGWTGPGNPRDASEAIRFLIVPLVDLVVFVGLFGLALWFRRRPETHKRLVLLAMTGGILPAAFGRVGPLAIPVGLSFLFAGPLYDRIVRGRIHRAYIWGVASIAISFPLRTLLARTETWQDLAEWMIQ
jgi:hypothetical protein